MKLGQSLVMAVVPPGALVPTGSALEQTLLQDLHDQISRKSRRERALVLTAREPVTSLNLLQVSIVANYQTTVLYLFWGLMCHTRLFIIQVAAVMGNVEAGEGATPCLHAHAIPVYRTLPAHIQLLATCSQVPAVPGS